MSRQDGENSSAHVLRVCGQAQRAETQPRALKNSHLMAQLCLSTNVNSPALAALRPSAGVELPYCGKKPEILQRPVIIKHLTKINGKKKAIFLILFPL